MSEYIVNETGYPGTIKQEIVGELVRCRDCRFWNTVFYRNKAGYGLCHKRSQLEATKNSDYCSLGDRKDEG